MGSSSSATSAVVQRFVGAVLPAVSDTSIEGGRLLQLMGGDSSGGGGGSSRGGAAGGAVLSSLLAAGLVSRGVREGHYVLVMPGMGPWVKSLLAGRKELAAMLARRKWVRGGCIVVQAGGQCAPLQLRPASTASGTCLACQLPAGLGLQRLPPAAQAPWHTPSPLRPLLRYSQMLERELLTQRKLAHSRLTLAFHVRDLLGRGAAQRLVSPGGTYIKLLKQRP